MKCDIKRSVKFRFVDYPEYYKVEKPETKSYLIHLFYIMQ